MQINIEELDHLTLKKILTMVHEHTGITIPEHKKLMIQRRLSTRMKFLSLSRYDDYLKTVKNNLDELTQFINLITTNETNFFRTERVWKYFEDIYLPDFIYKNPGKTLRAWSAASSTGEEAYSIAMCCEELRRRDNIALDYGILGSDISTKVIAQANLGEYKGRSVNNFIIKNKDRCERYLIIDKENFKISSAIKAKVNFKQHNLFKTLSDPISFDIIFLRNVLIYFSTTDQEKVIRNIEKKMSPNGILIIGESESLSTLKTNLTFIAPLVYRKEVGL